MQSEKRDHSVVGDQASSRSSKRVRNTTGGLTIENRNRQDTTTDDGINNVSSTQPNLVESDSHLSSDSDNPVMQSMGMSVYSFRRAFASISDSSPSQRRDPSSEPDSIPSSSRPRYLTRFLRGHGIWIAPLQNIEHPGRGESGDSDRVVDQILESIPDQGISFETDNEGRTVHCSTPNTQRARSLSSNSSSSSANSVSLNIQPSISPSSSNTVSDSESDTDSDDESNGGSDNESNSGSDSASSTSSRDSALDLPFPFPFPFLSTRNIPYLNPPIMPQLTLQPDSSENFNDIQERILEFLPMMQAANQTLERERAAGRLADRDIENVEEEGEYIEMDLGLGVLEEKMEDGENESESEKESEGHGDGGNSPNENVLGRLLGSRRAGKPKIEVM